MNNAVSRVAGLLAIALLGTFVSAQFGSSLDAELAGRPLTPAAQAAVTAAKDRPLAVARAPGVAPAERRALQAASRDASVDAFRFGLGVMALLTIAGGAIAAAGVTNLRRPVNAAGCPGGANIGAPQAVGGVPEARIAEPERAPA